MKIQKILVIILSISLLFNALYFISLWHRNIVTSVPDGDSLQLADGRRVRLLGLDAPERGRCAADEARTTLTQAASGKHIRLKNVVTDDYGRQLANVIIEDFPIWVSYMRWRFFHWSTTSPQMQGPTLQKDYPDPDPYLNRMMVSRGLARFSSAKSEYYNTLKQAQTDAKNRKLGIWSETCRKTSNPDCSIKGNIRAGKKTYLLSDCKNYDQTIIDESYGDRWFCSEKEAVAAGFSKASGCH